MRLLQTPQTSDGTGPGVGRRSESTLRGQVDQLLPTPTTGRGAENSDGDPGLRGVDRLLPTPSTMQGGETHRSGDRADEKLLPGVVADLFPTPDASMGGAGGRSGDPDKRRDEGRTVTINEVAQHLPTPRSTDGRSGSPNQRGSSGDLMLAPAVLAQEINVWGVYEPAIRQWERVVGRLAPWATEPSPRSKKGRLSPRFVEWLMGWAEGWVTAIPKLTRNQQLRILGNGVVPQQAAEAVRFLLSEPGHREPPKRKSKAPKRATARGLMKAAREAA